MTTSLTPELSLGDDKVPMRSRWFFQRLFLRAAYDLIIREFRRLEDAGLLSKTRLAARIGKEPSQVTRWLSSPSNITLNTMSLLLVGMAVNPSSVLAERLPVGESDLRLVDRGASGLVGFWHGTSPYEHRPGITDWMRPAEAQLSRCLKQPLIAGRAEPTYSWAGTRRASTQSRRDLGMTPSLDALHS